MHELREQRKFNQTREAGSVFRYTERYYDCNGKVIGIARMLDGPEDKQGFYGTNSKGRKQKIDMKAPSWKRVEEIMRQALTDDRG